jgi:hypothetical protein
VAGPTAPPREPPPEPPPYVYAATDIRPRQAREIELCAKASHFDWMYTGTAALGVVSGIFVNTQYLKQAEQPGVRMIGPAWIGLFWGGLLGGGYLSLPKCDPEWAYGPPPEGNIRADWPVAASIALIATATAPLMDYTFLGYVRPEWQDWERTTRVFVAMGTGLAGSLLPYVLSPTPWAAKKEIERIRVGAVSGGPFLSYTTSF